MDFKQLRYILKVAETKNITKAAGELFITQPALSHYVSKVEKDLGIQLFNRMTTPISLTVAGECYVETAKKILNLEMNLRERLADIATMKQGHIVMGLPPARAAYVLPLVISRFRDKYPGVKLETVEKNSVMLKEFIKTGKVDFALIPMREGLDSLNEDKDLEGEIIAMEELFLVSHVSLLSGVTVKKGGVVDFEQVKNKPFVMLRKNRGIRKAVDAVFMHYGTKMNVAMETSSNDSAYRLAAAGIGMAIVPAMTLYQIPSNKDVHIYHLSEQGMKWPLSFVHRKGEYLSVLKLEISDLLEELFENAPKIVVNNN